MTLWQFATATVLLLLLSLATLAIYIKHKYDRLETKIFRRLNVPHAEREKSNKGGHFQTIPATLLDNPNASALLHEQCYLPIPAYRISDRSTEHFTRLLRHNMTAFARLPQAWIFWLMLSKQRHTLSTSYIDRLDFVEGDLVCGLCRVVRRGPTSVEMVMEAPPSFGGVGGLLVVRLRGSIEGTFLVTETLQWKVDGEMGDLPLSKPLPKFLHEVASASLLVSGAKFLGALDA